MVTILPEVIRQAMTTEEKTKIEQLYLEMYDLLLSYSLSSLTNESLAEEAVQETFRIVCMKPEALFGSPNPKGWLLNTLKYTISNIKRSRAAATRLMAVYMTSQDPDLLVSEDGMPLEVLYEDIAGTDEFQLIREMAVEGRSHLEMAQKRGISVAACKKRVQRAKEYLRKKLL